MLYHCMLKHEYRKPNEEENIKYRFYCVIVRKRLNKTFISQQKTYQLQREKLWLCCLRAPHAATAIQLCPRTPNLITILFLFYFLYVFCFLHSTCSSLVQQVSSLTNIYKTNFDNRVNSHLLLRQTVREPPGEIFFFRKKQDKTKGMDA